MAVPEPFFDFFDGYVYATAWLRWFFRSPDERDRAERVVMEWLHWCRRGNVAPLHAGLMLDDYLELFETVRGAAAADQAAATLHDFYDWVKIQRFHVGGPGSAGTDA